MKKLMLTLAALGLMMSSHAKHDGEGKGKRQGEGFSAEKAAERKVNKLSDSIEMSESQKKSMTTTFEKFYKKVHEIRTSENPDKAEMKNAKETRDSEVKTILNDDAKYIKYENMTARKHKKGDGHKKGNRKGMHKGKKEGKCCKDKEEKTDS